MKNTVPPDFYRESLMNQLAPHEFILEYEIRR
jgi:hypothetical protein